MTEREVLSAYSTPGLKQNQLPTAAKKDHLLQLRVPGEKIEEILDRLYGPQAVPLAVIDDQPEQSTGAMVRLENGWCSECERRTYGRKPLVRGSTTKRIPIKSNGVPDVGAPGTLRPAIKSVPIDWRLGQASSPGTGYLPAV
jgi:hypothetical protein